MATTGRLMCSARLRRLPCRAEKPTVGIAADDTNRAAAVTASSAAQVERPSDESTVVAALAMALEEAGPAELSSLDVDLREYLVAVVCDVRLRRRTLCTRREAVGKLQRNGGRKPRFPVHVGRFTCSYTTHMSSMFDEVRPDAALVPILATVSPRARPRRSHVAARRPHSSAGPERARGDAGGDAGARADGASQ